MAKLKKAEKSKQIPSASSLNRKMEVLGVVMIALGAMVLVGIATYNPSDWGIISSTNVDVEVLEPRIKNGLSITGAWFSHYLVKQFLGYFSSIVPIILLIFGWFTFRHKDQHQLFNLSGKLLWTMLLLAVSSAWIHLQLDLVNDALYGIFAKRIAELLKAIFGVIGSAIFILTAIITSLILFFSPNLQQFIDNIKQKLSSLSWPTFNIGRPKKDESPSDQMEPPSNKTASSEVVMDESSNVTEEEADKIEQILDASKAREEAIKAKQQAEQAEVAKQKPRAIIDQEVSENEEVIEDEDGVKLEVYQGEEEEEAGKRDLDKARSESIGTLPRIKYRFPGLELLDIVDDADNELDFEEIEQNKRIILEKLGQHKIEILAINAIVGPTVTLYELEPAPHVKIGKIESYANDLKMATAAHGIRIIAPIPGKSAVGIEIPNQKRQMVTIRQVINTKKFADTKLELPVAFGKTIENELFIVDLAKMPHLLVAGATGSGKSVGINTIITCLLYKCHPDNLKFVMVDPKKIELSLYRQIERHYLASLPHAEEPIVTDTSKALEILKSTTLEMDNRYDLLKLAGARNIKEYNAKFNQGKLDEDDGHRHLPYIVVIIDELADLMMTAGKQIEEPIARLAQLARAIGIHLVVATQRPSVNVITGTIKANFPARIAYQVASKVDSRTILDSMGADQLVGKGDMLFTNGGAGGMTRIQNAFVSTEEVEKVTEFIGKQAGYNDPYMLPVVEEEGSASMDILEEKDAMFEEAAALVVLHQQGSVSLLQRKLKLGYNRAGRIVDQLYAAGIVGPYKGSTAREVLVTDDEELQDILRNL